ncbi:MAG: hypothetical protein EPO11_11170 [Gammaproteobacteria bacterium]|nr:MAG: hypothetical protein EPO11_11170 [Gammaproteobacteria bacterium]
MLRNPNLSIVNKITSCIEKYITSSDEFTGRNKIKEALFNALLLEKIEIKDDDPNKFILSPLNEHFKSNCALTKKIILDQLKTLVDYYNPVFLSGADFYFSHLDKYEILVYMYNNRNQDGSLKLESKEFYTITRNKLELFGVLFKILNILSLDLSSNGLHLFSAEQWGALGTALKTADIKSLDLSDNFFGELPEENRKAFFGMLEECGITSVDLLDNDHSENEKKCIKEIISNNNRNLTSIISYSIWNKPEYRGVAKSIEKKSSNIATDVIDKVNSYKLSKGRAMFGITSLKGPDTDISYDSEGRVISITTSNFIFNTEGNVISRRRKISIVDLESIDDEEYINVNNNSTSSEDLKEDFTRRFRF